MTRERRFLVPRIGGQAQARIVGEEAHHLIHVLRLRAGDAIVVFDGEGAAFHAVLSRCERTYALARVLAPVVSRESSLEIWMALAVPKGDRMPFALQKLTELGVSRVYPLAGARTVGRRERQWGERLSRWRRIAAEACKQSGRSQVPEVREPIAFADFLELDLPAVRLLVAPGGDAPPGGIRPRTCLAVVGPEGGWTDEEISSAAAKGFRTLGLGPRVLRTETAAIAAATVLQWEWGDLKPSEREAAGAEPGRG